MILKDVYIKDELIISACYKEKDECAGRYNSFALIKTNAEQIQIYCTRKEYETAIMYLQRITELNKCR